jgi:hypothetical protein
MSERAAEPRSTEVRVSMGGTQLNQMEMVGTSTYRRRTIACLGRLVNTPTQLWSPACGGLSHPRRGPAPAAAAWDPEVHAKPARKPEGKPLRSSGWRHPPGAAA